VLCYFILFFVFFKEILKHGILNTAENFVNNTKMEGGFRKKKLTKKLEKKERKKNILHRTKEKTNCVSTVYQSYWLVLATKVWSCCWFYSYLTFNVTFRPMYVLCSDWLHVVLKQAQVWDCFLSPKQASFEKWIFLLHRFVETYSALQNQVEVYQLIYFWTNEVIQKMWRLYCQRLMNSNSGQVLCRCPLLCLLPFSRPLHPCTVSQVDSSIV